MDRETLLDLIPAYALGALDADERQAVEALLANDAEAQALLAEYQVITDTLVLATPPQAAPSHLRGDLRRRLKQAPPAPQVAARPRRWPLLALAAALLVVAAGVVAFLLADRDPEPLSGAALFAQITQQEGVLRVQVVPGDGGPDVTGELVAAPDGSQAVIEVRNLPVLPDDQIYQLWLSAPEGVTSGGLFQAAADSPTYIVLPITEPVTHYRGFGVSREEAGGSPFPDRPAGTGMFRVPLST